MFRAFVGQTLIPSSSSSSSSPASSPSHIRTCRCLFARFRFMCLFCFYEHKDKFTRSVGVQATAQVDCPRYFPSSLSSSSLLSSFSFMRFYLFIYSNKLQCQLNHRTLLVFRFSLLRPPLPPLPLPLLLANLFLGFIESHYFCLPCE